MCKLVCRVCCQNIRSGSACRRIESHIQGYIASDAEATADILEMFQIHSQIIQNILCLSSRQHGNNIRIISMNELNLLSSFIEGGGTL